MAEWAWMFRYPDDWVEVVHHGALPVEEQLRREVDAVWGHLVPEEREQVADAVGTLVAHDAEGEAALSAHGYHTDERGLPVHAHLSLRIPGREHPGSVEAELAGIASRAPEAPHTVEPPEVTRVDLPAGPAVRVRALEEAPDGDGGAVLLESLTYWLPIPETSDVAWIRFWTPNVALADDLVALFEAMAEAFVVDYEPA